MSNAAERGGRLCLFVTRSALSLALQALNVERLRANSLSPYNSSHVTPSVGSPICFRLSFTLGTRVRCKSTANFKRSGRPIQLTHSHARRRTFPGRGPFDLQRQTARPSYVVGEACAQSSTRRSSPLSQPRR
ncbi:hypothetical protein EVAR_96097_1 [Eumeta japonica]|uniref:Uncharacterized protein n=1 Tax=Eumeta variegata TaxID=151549 RepID=A0A4C1VDC5_EUMVA|nr:hypothetical protein EVAR_96097_1 [Eumeta japonica]